MPRTPAGRRPRSPRDRAVAVALWVLIGALVGVAVGVWVVSPAALAAVGAVLGGIYGYASTRAGGSHDELGT